MPRLFLHIGAHKTGTTSLQKYLDVSGPLLASAGYTYPRICRYHFAQHRLAFAAKKMRDPALGDIPDLDVELREATDFLEQSSTDVVLSSEEFFSLPPQAIEKLAVLKDVAEVRITASIRRQDTLLMSIFNQVAKHPGAKFPRSLWYFINHPRTISRDMVLYQCLSGWASVFGKESMSVMLFEQESVIEQFLRIIGIQSSGPDAADTRLNRSISLKAAEALDFFKRACDDVELQKQVLEKAAQLFPRTDDGCGLTADQSRNILKKFDADNDRMFEEFSLGENIYHSATIDDAATQGNAPLTRLEMATLFAEVLKGR